MKKLPIILAGAALWSAGTTVAAGGMEDDPILLKVMLDQLEMRDTEEGKALGWEADAWIGRDLNKLWFKSAGQRMDGVTEEGDAQLLYSRAVAPYWDMQIGWKHDFSPKPERDWLAFGFKGLAPYYFDIDAALFVGASGRTAAAVTAEYEMMLTQRWVLSPELEISAFGKDDPETGSEAGLGEIAASLRLAYEIRRESAPYIGLRWVKEYGGAAGGPEEEHAADSAGSNDGDLQFVAGVRIWF